MTRLSPDEPLGTDRRRVTLTAALSVTMLVLQFGAIVWGASALNSSVQQLGKTMTELQRATEANATAISTMAVDVGVLKALVRTRP